MVGPFGPETGTPSVMSTVLRPSGRKYHYWLYPWGTGTDGWTRTVNFRLTTRKSSWDSTAPTSRRSRVSTSALTSWTVERKTCW